MIAVVARPVQQGHAALPAELEKQRLIIHHTVHDHGLHQTFEVPSFQPQAFGLMRAVLHRLKRPSTNGRCDTRQNEPYPYTHPSLWLSRQVAS